MVLLSDARHSALPSLPFLGDQRRRPRVDEMIEYLSYVEGDLGVKTVWGVRAAGVERRGSGSVLHLSTTEGEVQTRNVVCATGASAHPRHRHRTAPGDDLRRRHPAPAQGAPCRGPLGLGDGRRQPDPGAALASLAHRLQDPSHCGFHPPHVFFAGAVRTGGAALRGGNWNNNTNAGAFTLNLNNSPTNTNNNIGFRCVWFLLIETWE